MSVAILSVCNISKTYFKTTVLSNTSIDLFGGIYGLLGPNGAGKTTFMHIVATLINSNKGGKILFHGKDIKHDIGFYRSKLGFTPQEIQLPNTFSVYEFLMYMANLKGIDDNKASLQIRDLLKTTNLTSRMSDRIKSLSSGMKQRLNIIQAFLGDPEIILLDEPTRGLDIEERDRVLNFIATQRNKVIIISSHLAKDIQLFCSDVIILDSGRLLYNNQMSNMIDYYSSKIWYKDFSRDQFVFDQLKVDIISQYVNGNNIRIKVFSEQCPDDGWQSADVSIEDIYLKIIGR